jgi:glycolate oxidase iron-sulfur subunit
MQTIIPNRRRYDLLMQAMRLSQKLLPKRAGSTRHLPLLFENKMAIPELTRRTALRILPEKTGGGKKRVGLFLGCLINYVYPEIALSTVDLLELTGHTVIIPKSQVCCGIPALYLGDTAAFQRLRSKNIRSFRAFKLDAIVTACASCGTALKQEYGRTEMGASKQVQGETLPLGAKVYDISEFLADKSFLAGGKKEKVTYHDPCHLRFSQGIWREPRKILSQVAEIAETDEAWRCCGGGGTFSLFFHKLSRAIGEEKCKALQETGARTVVTACPGCILQLKGILSDTLPVRHVVEVISEKCINETAKLSCNIDPAQSVFIRGKGSVS